MKRSPFASWFRAFAHDLLDVAAVALDLETVEAGELDRLAAERAERLRDLHDLLAERNAAARELAEARREASVAVERVQAGHLIELNLHHEQMATVASSLNAASAEVERLRAGNRDGGPTCTCGTRPMTEVASLGLWVCACGVVAQVGWGWRAPDVEHARGLLKMAAAERSESPVEAAQRTWKERAVREAGFAARLERAAALESETCKWCHAPPAPGDNVCKECRAQNAAHSMPVQEPSNGTGEAP